METNETKSGCLCGSGEYIVIACSGACDLGQVTDLVARELRDNKVRKMNCLAAVGAGINPTIESFKSANLLLLDGCPVDCGKKILEQAGIENFHYIRITDLGYIKGQTPVTEGIIKEVYEKVEAIY
ncbi:MAG: putative zinc-binding protein [Salinivirgaceae bacterium]|nr:putative zinc-binding protein [Salinivirgaceae bacterium]